MSVIVYFLCFLLFMIGLYAVIVKKNLLKIAIGLTIMEYAVSLFLVMLGYRWDGHVPVIEYGAQNWLYVDPIPQSMVLVLIVTGLATLALFVSICVRLYEKYGTFDVTEIRKLKG